MRKQTELERALALPETNFARYLQSFFGYETAQDVLKIFQQMGIPAPETEEEFIKGTEGGLVFLNQYGIVIRIEGKNIGYGERINNSPWILKPLASIPAIKAIIEICPGCIVGTGKEPELLRSELGKQGIDYCDDQIANSGRLPIATPSFPEGIPVVIDRLAVRTLTERVVPLKIALEAVEIREVVEAEEKLYAPLRQCFSRAWSGKKEMQNFWSLCLSYAQDGKLIAGWNEESVAEEKTLTASNKSKKYAARLQAAEQKPLSSTLPAIPQSRSQPA